MAGRSILNILGIAHLAVSRKALGSIAVGASQAAGIDRVLVRGDVVEDFSTTFVDETTAARHGLRKPPYG